MARYGKLFIRSLTTSAAVGAIVLATPAAAKYAGETITCHFGKHGKVVIDTREPGTTITLKGRRYPAASGSYFYQTDDGKIAILFGPRESYWIFDDIRDNDCSRKANRPSR